MPQPARSGWRGRTGRTDRAATRPTGTGRSPGSCRRWSRWRCEVSGRSLSQDAERDRRPAPGGLSIRQVAARLGRGHLPAGLGAAAPIAAGAGLPLPAADERRRPRFEQPMRKISERPFPPADRSQAGHVQEHRPQRPLAPAPPGGRERAQQPPHACLLPGQQDLFGRIAPAEVDRCEQLGVASCSCPLRFHPGSAAGTNDSHIPDAATFS
jgi:hypothetical protein